MAPTSGDFVGDGVHPLSAFLEPNNAFYCSIGYETMGVESSIVAVEQSMTLDFLDGMLVAMLPSMLTVAWLVWRAA